MHFQPQFVRAWLIDVPADFKHLSWTNLKSLLNYFQSACDEDLVASIHCILMLTPSFVKPAPQKITLPGLGFIEEEMEMTNPSIFYPHKIS